MFSYLYELRRILVPRRPTFVKLSWLVNRVVLLFSAWREGGLGDAVCAKSIECVERWRYHRFKHGLNGKPGIWLPHAVVPNNYENMHSNKMMIFKMFDRESARLILRGQMIGRQAGRWVDGWGWIMRKDTINLTCISSTFSRKDAWTFIN